MPTVDAFRVAPTRWRGTEDPTLTASNTSPLKLSSHRPIQPVVGTPPAADPYIHVAMESKWLRLGFG